MAVVWHHLFVLFPGDFARLRELSPLAYSIGGWVSDQNKNAVLLFFVLSGFAIRLSLRRGLPTDGQSARHYAARRAYRILPLYWFALLWTALIGWLTFGLADQSFSPQALAGNLAFLQTSTHAAGGWFPPYGLNGPLWSLSYEVFYYAILPLAAVALTRVVGRRMIMPAFVIVSLAISLLAILVNRFAPSPFSNFLAFWHIWVLGFVLADSWRSGGHFPYALVSCGLIVLVEFVASTSGYGSDTLLEVRAGSVIAALAYLVLLAGTRLPKRLLARASKIFSSLFYRVGRGSYALYLLHYPLLLGLSSILGQYAATGVAAVGIAGTITLAFAAMVCPEIEVRLSRLTPRSREPANAMAATETAP